MNRKVLVPLVAVLLAAVLAGTGALATWTATTSATSTVAAGTVLIVLGDTGAATNVSTATPHDAAGNTASGNGLTETDSDFEF